MFLRCRRESDLLMDRMSRLFCVWPPQAWEVFLYDIHLLHATPGVIGLWDVRANLDISRWKQVMRKTPGPPSTSLISSKSLYTRDHKGRGLESRGPKTLRKSGSLSRQCARAWLKRRSGFGKALRRSFQSHLRPDQEMAIEHCCVQTWRLLGLNCSIVHVTGEGFYVWRLSSRATFLGLDDLIIQISSAAGWKESHVQHEVVSDGGRQIHFLLY